MAEPPPGPLGRFLKRHPEAQPKVARAVGSLLGACLVALAAIGFLIIWHMIRRGRLIREGQPAPRIVRLDDLTTAAPDDEQDDPDELLERRP